MKNLSILAILSTALLTGAFCSDSSSPVPAIPAVVVPAAVQSPDFPYDFPCTDGLYATIVGALGAKGIHVSGEQMMKLQVPGFRKEMPVQAVIQDHTAPLAVVILGMGANANSDFSKVWPAWFAEAGFHVLYFDNTFGPSFQKVCGRGASGNLWAETESIRDIIDAFLKTDQMRGKVSEIRVAGYSYGGVQALILGKMSAEGQLPFQLSGIQAFDPPINLMKTAEILDTWYNEDRWKYTLAELKQMFSDAPPCNGSAPIKIPDTAMRGAVAAVFRIGLADTVLANDDLYKLNVLPHGNEFDDEYVRRDYAEAYGFSRFAQDFSLPYWQSKLGKDAIVHMVEETDVCKLVRSQPAFTEVIETRDDPFNSAVDLERLRECATNHRLTILPRGGHLGYMQNPWTRTKLLSMFAATPVR